MYQCSPIAGRRSYIAFKFGGFRISECNKCMLTRFSIFFFGYLLIMLVNARDKAGTNRDKQRPAGTRQGHTGTSRDSPSLSLFDHVCPSLSLCVPVCPCLIPVCPCLSLSVHVYPCLSLSFPFGPCMSVSVRVCPCLFLSVPACYIYIF